MDLKLWTTKETAEALGVSSSFLEKNRHLVPCIKLGRRVVYDPARVREVLRQREFRNHQLIAAA